MTDNFENSNRKRVLTEDEYLEAMNDIIMHHYFPDLPKLRKKLAVLEGAEERLKPSRTEFTSTISGNERLQNTEYAGDLQSRLSSVCSTPSLAFDNRSTVASNTEQYSDDPTVRRCYTSLSSFIAANTSEDNYSFEKLISEEEREKRRKGLILSEERLPGSSMAVEFMQVQNNGKPYQIVSVKEGSDLTVLQDKRPRRLQFWPYREKNTLFYSPAEAPLTSEERLIRQITEQRKEIRRYNTRFRESSLATELYRIQTDRTTESDNSVLGPKQEEVRLLKRLGQKYHSVCSEDAEEENDMELSKTNPLESFLPSSPVLSPRSIPNSPFLVWGQVAATPQILKEEDEAVFSWMASSSGKKQGEERNRQSFHIPKMDTREEAARHLEQKLTGKKKVTSKDHSVHRTPSVGLSPAAQRLADTLKIPTIHSVRRTPFHSYGKDNKSMRSLKSGL